MKKIIILFWLALAIPNLAKASSFVEVKLPRGIEIQLPKGWRLLGAEHNQLIEISAEAALDLSGAGQPEGTEVNLIAANSMPRSTYAAIRVDSTTPASGSPSEIANLTPAELKEFESEIKRTLKEMLPHQGLKVLTFFGVRREIISGQPALITEYRRSGPNGPVIVSVVQIFTPRQDIRINLSYRESEKIIWRPVIGKVFQSITIRHWP